MLIIFIPLIVVIVGFEESLYIVNESDPFVILSVLLMGRTDRDIVVVVETTDTGDADCKKLLMLL